MKTVLAGLGRMGLRHLEVLRSLDLELVGAADPFEEARNNAVKEGIAENLLFDDALKMIEETSPECVIVATTAPYHCELVVAAAKAGAKAVMCEKPMGVSLAECDQMIEACKASGTRLATNHQMRFMDQYTSSKDIVSSEAFGGLSGISAMFGNFGMAMNGSHYFEMFRFMTDEDPVKVSAWFSKDIVANPRGAQFEDHGGSLRLETASGKRFYMDASTDQGHGMFVSYAGPNGRLDVDELAGHTRLVLREEEHRKQPTTRYGMPYDTIEKAITPADAVAPTRSVMEALLKGENYPDGETGRLVLEVLVGAYLSHEADGKTIDLRTTDLPRDRVFPWA